MSHRSGSSITSPLFMVEPVPIRTTTSFNNFHLDDQSLYIKGDHEPSNNTYHHIGGDDDVFIIDGPNESFQLNRNSLKETLEHLKTKAHTPMDQLSHQDNEIFRSVVESLRLLYGSQALYDIVLADIRTVFSDVTDVRPGTVAAFFIGCFTDDKFPGPMGCSPKCAASLRPTEGTPGYADCSDLVLMYSNSQFSSLNEKQSSHVYVFIGDPIFNGFTDTNISQLRDSGVQQVTLIYGNQDGSYREVTSPIPLDNLPKLNSPPLSSTPPSQSPITPNNTSPSSGSGTGVIFFIVIIIILILLGAILYRSYNRSW